MKKKQTIQLEKPLSHTALGAEYGLCCAAADKLQKPGSCPASGTFKSSVCGVPCQHDLECQGADKCCHDEANTCGKHCVPPHNFTRKLARWSRSVIFFVCPQVFTLSFKENHSYFPFIFNFTAYFRIFRWIFYVDLHSFIVAPLRISVSQSVYSNKRSLNWW